jgi:hypothetical protein
MTEELRRTLRGANASESGVVFMAMAQKGLASFSDAEGGVLDVIS